MKQVEILVKPSTAATDLGQMSIIYQFWAGRERQLNTERRAHP